MMDNKKKFAIASLVMSIISLIPIVISPNSLSGAQIFVIIGILCAIIAIVLGFLGKNASKGFAISGIVIGVISSVFLCLAMIGFFGIQSATDCVDNGDETSTCSYLGEELIVPNSMLSEEQLKK